MPVVPDNVRLRAEALGAPGVAWLNDLPRLPAEIEHERGISVGSTLGGGRRIVTEARTEDGQHLVLKLAMPQLANGQVDFEREISALQDAHGRGYPCVVRFDPTRRSALLERLGRPLTALDHPIESQIDIIGETLATAWRRPRPPRGGTPVPNKPTI